MEIEVTSKNIVDFYKNGKRDFRGANLEGANLEGANLEGANLEGANLEGANLWGANLEGANLAGANLWDANLAGANLWDANLWSANLRGANLRGANLRGANLEGSQGIASVSGVSVANRFIFAYRYQGENHFQIGCFNNVYQHAIDAITAKYNSNTLSKYLKPYLLAIEYLNESLNAQYHKYEA